MFRLYPINICDHVKSLEHCGNQVRNTLKVLKCGPEEGWRISVSPIM
jgi:hypothetical protein